MNLKQILNAVLMESGFLERAAFTTSGDTDDKQMVAIANRVAYQIMNHYNWSVLRNTFELVMTSATTYPLPIKFQNFVADSSFVNNGSRRVEFPVPEGRWFSYKFGSSGGGGLVRARRYGGNIEIPAPSPGEVLNFEYITKCPITSSAGQPKETFTADEDLWLLDDELLILGTQARWGQVKQFPQYAEWMADFRKAQAEAIVRDTGARTVGGNSRSGNDLSPYYPLWSS